MVRGGCARRARKSTVPREHPRQQKVREEVFTWGQLYKVGARVTAAPAARQNVMALDVATTPLITPQLALLRSRHYGRINPFTIQGVLQMQRAVPCDEPFEAIPQPSKGRAKGRARDRLGATDRDPVFPRVSVYPSEKETTFAASASWGDRLRRPAPPACHAGGRGFKSRLSRQFRNLRPLIVAAWAASPLAERAAAISK